MSKSEMITFTTKYFFGSKSKWPCHCSELISIILFALLDLDSDATTILTVLAAETLVH